MARGKRYKSELKLSVVKDLLRGEKTQEQICVKYGISRSVVNKWKKEFDKKAPLVFEMEAPKKVKAEEDPEYLVQLVGKLTVENDILKKVLGVWG